MRGFTLRIQGADSTREPELWHHAHSFERATHTNYTLILLTTPPGIPNKLTLLAAAITGILGSVELKLRVGVFLVVFWC